ncbi:MAG: tyrosine-protein phosphatase [Shinella sp.]|nr:tyrosine-protein phosphatase [Shinella sp.]
MLLAILAGLHAAHLLLTGNFHEVVAGELYRSSQPSPVEIASMKRDYGIRTIINLRGAARGKAWYDDEVAAAKALDINHVDFPMSAARELNADEATRLIALMRDAPKPILIHCKAGADRTGLAAAFYAAGIAKLGELAAEQQISITYGHFSIFFSSAYAMDRTFEMMEPALGFPNS